MLNNTFDMNFTENFLHNEQMLTAIAWIAEQIPGGFFVYRADAEQEILYINSAMLRIFGCQSLEEFKVLTGNTFRGMVYPQDFDRIQGSIDKQIADQSNQNLDYVEYRIIRKDGAVRWVDDYGHLGEIPGYGKVYYVFISDITEKHYLQEENSRWLNIYQGMVTQFNALAENSLTMIRANLTAGVIEEVRGYDLYDTDYAGGNVAEMIQKRLDSFLLPEDRKHYEEIFQLGKLIDHYYHGGEPAALVGYCQRQSGRKCFVKISVRAAINPVSGDVIVFLTEMEYNTEKVTSILNQKLLAQQFDMVAYLIGEDYGIVIGEAADIHKGSIFPHQHNGNFTEYIHEQVLPVIHGTEEEKNAVIQALSISAVEEYLNSHEVYTVDVVCKIEEEIYHKRFIFYLVNRKSRFYILLQSDITDVIRKEHQMNELLENALREARSANDAKTTFLSNMSHEIRTPMNAIVGLDSIALQLPDLSPQVRDYLEKIGDSAKHLLTIINDILDMSRIESGHMKLRKEAFSFQDMLGQIDSMIQAQCRNKGLTYNCRIIGRLNDDYIGDDMRLKQILINILSNAIKFTDAPGTITMTIEQTAEFEDNATLRFVITDTGIGMEQSYLPKIFDAFSQENRSHYNKPGSTGLGLTITKNIVEMMNGNITVRSEKDKGSEFTVAVTLRKSKSDEHHADREQHENICHPDLAGKKILLAEDVQINAEIMKEIFSMCHMQADYAENGRQAVAMFQASPPGYYDAILMDVRMPVMNGLQACSAIRKLNRPDAGTIPIIAMTANAFDEDVQNSLQAGMNAHLSKPVEMDRLYSTLENLIGKTK